MSRIILNVLITVVTIVVAVPVIIFFWYATRSVFSPLVIYKCPADSQAITHIQLPTRIVPNYSGGYTIQHSDPTEFPTQVRPDGNGGFIADQLGHQPTYIHPDLNGGYTIYRPFHHQIMSPAQLDDEESR